MNLGAFSISLGVKDLAESRAFYEALGFTAFAGTEEHNYLIMKNGETLVGLFQGMFEGAMLTFNPGWDQSAGEVNPFTDIREIKAESPTGRASRSPRNRARPPAPPASSSPTPTASRC